MWSFSRKVVEGIQWKKLKAEKIHEVQTYWEISLYNSLLQDQFSHLICLFSEKRSKGKQWTSLKERTSRFHTKKDPFILFSRNWSRRGEEPDFEGRRKEVPWSFIFHNKKKSNAAGEERADRIWVKKEKGAQTSEFCNSKESLFSISKEEEEGLGRATQAKRYNGNDKMKKKAILCPCV